MKIIDGTIAFPDADEFMVGELQADGTYQADHLAAALKHVTNFTCAIDGGAHVGVWTRIMANRFQRVIAVEPSPDTFEALSWNIDHWRLTNVVLMHRAVWRDDGYVEMVLDPVQAERKNTGGRFVRGVRYTASGNGLPSHVRRETIDSWNIQSLGLLKLDVEGSELAALEGARATLLRCNPIVLVEEKGLGTKYFDQRKDSVQRFLKDLGYRRAQSVGCDEIWKPH